MKHTNKNILITCCVFIVLTACSSNKSTVQSISRCEDAAQACKKFTLLHTNDNHGRFWQNSLGEYGMAARKALIDKIKLEVRSAGGDVLLLSGGDINTGVPESDLQDARPDFIGMNLIGYDAMAVGNHEFDNPLNVLEGQRNLAKFPMLSANIYFKGTNKRYFDPYKVVNVNGIKVAVIGLTTEDTAKLVNPEYVKDLVFVKPSKEIKKVIAEINDNDNEDVDLIFAVTHMGHYANAQNGNNAPGDVALARSLAHGVLNVIVGGHSQNPVCMSKSDHYANFNAGDNCQPDKQNGTYIMQAHEWGKYVGRADFEYFEDKLKLVNYQLIPVNLKRKNELGVYVHVAKSIQPNKLMIDKLKPYQDKGQKKLREQVAETDLLLDGERSSVRFKQTNLGQLIAAAQIKYTNADIGIVNAGGVRASILAGKITYRDILTTQPFANEITFATMHGHELSEYLGTVASIQVDSGGYAQIRGVKMDVDCLSRKVDIKSINGKEYDANGMYSFSISKFSASGTDNYPVIESKSIGYTDSDVLYKYLKNKTVPIKAKEYIPNGEVRYFNSVTSEGCKITGKT